MYVEDMEIHMRSDLLLIDSTDESIQLSALLDSVSDDVCKAKRLIKGSNDMKYITSKQAEMNGIYYTNSLTK